MELNVTKENINIKGSIGESAKAYRGYDVNYKNENLYIKIRSSIALELPPLLHRSGEFIISIPNKYGKINEIYFEGRDPSDNTRIWPKN